MKRRELTLWLQLCITGYGLYCPWESESNLQRVHLRGWDQILFPSWPVDRSVENLFEFLMLLTLKSQKVEKIPFVWFWPRVPRVLQ